MKQKELTLKLTLAIVALTSLSAATSLIVPTYATTTTDDGSDTTTTTTGLADIVNRTTMMIPSEEDIRDLFTGAITDALQQNIQIVQETSTITIPAGSSGDVRVSCQGGAPLTGGGFDSANENLQILRSFPLDGTTWQVSAIHEDPGDQDTGVLVAYALCLVVSE